MRTAIIGFGNLGRGVLRALMRAEDARIVGIFSRREKNEVCTEANISVFPADRLFDFENDIDVLFICGGSADDLPVWTPRFAHYFNVVDSFDRHPEIRKHFERVDSAAKEGNHLALISAGWDPGILSAVRCASKAVLPDCRTVTFWGEGVSQGHSEALRRINGVKDAFEVTVPNAEAVKNAGENGIFENDDRKNHIRRCYVTADEGADRKRIENEIRTMPVYFDGYETEVNFVSEIELYSRFSSLYHKGRVLSAYDKNGTEAQADFKLSMRSNPDFTGAVLVACGRAVYAAAKRGRTGAVTVFDLPLADMLPPSLSAFDCL